jgi:hypothetical protein
MQSQATLKRHAALVDQMAQARGFDLEEEILRGHMTVSELGDAVLSCTGCTQPGACDHWLASQDSVVSASPAYCRNADLFGALGKG